MPRNIPVQALLKLAQTTGLEPVNIIRIQWIVGGGYYYYADRAIKDQPQIQGKLLSLADLEAVISIDKGTSSTSVQVKLDDTDGSIKTIFDRNDIHNRPVVIYQWFAEADFSINYMFSIFQGAIGSPIEWNEGDRTLSFDVLTILDDREAGFSVEDGDFVNVPDILLGKSWPQVFGTVQDMPTVPMDEKPSGTTLIPLSIPDYNILSQISYIDCQAAQTAGKATCLSLRSAELLQQVFGADLISNTPNDQVAPVKVGDSVHFTPDGTVASGPASGVMYTIAYSKGGAALAKQLTQANQKEADAATAIANKQGAAAAATYNRAIQIRCQAYQMMNSVNNTMISKIQALQATFNQQAVYNVNTIPIVNGHKFLQGQQIEIKISDALFTGSFQGDIFTVTSKLAPQDVLRDANGKQISDAFGNLLTGNELSQQFAPAITNQPGQTPVQPGLTITSDDCTGGSSGSAFSMEAYWACEAPWHVTFCKPDAAKESSNKGKPWFAQAGATVDIGRDYPMRYILSITPGTTVLYLSAKKIVSNIEVITPIPQSYYEISTLQLGSITALIATFTQPLSTYVEEYWTDTICATLKSSIGPNVVDILIYLIQTYTENAIDSTSFNHVRGLLINYPANFALMEKKNIVTLLKEIAWQSRCSIWVADDIFYIKFLPEMLTPVDVITEDDIEQQTLKVSTTPTEDLVTKLIGTWKSSYAVSAPNKVVLTYNINKYGLIERTFDFYIFNDVSLVEKSCVFWMIRMSNVWKRLICRCMLTKLKGETMDNITVNLAHHSVADIPVVGVLEKSTFNSAEFAIDMEVWLPVRLGEMLPYAFAYPAGLNVVLLWPTVTDIAGGFVNDVPQSKGAAGNLAHPSSGGNGNQVGSGRQYDPGPAREAYVVPPDWILVFVPATEDEKAADRARKAADNQARQDAANYALNPLAAPDAPRVNSIPDVPILPLTSRTFPGFVTVKNGDNNIYSGTIYPDGLDQDSVDVPKIKVLEVDKNDTLPNPTWGMVTEQPEYNGDGDVIYTYYLHPSVYVAPLPPDGP